MGCRAILAVILATATLWGCTHTHEHGPHTHTHTSDQPPWQAATAWPDRIMVTLKGAPQTSFAVTWRTDQSVDVTQAQIVEARADARFDLGAQTVAARTERLDPTVIEAGEQWVAIAANAGLAPVHFHSVEFTGLKPDTTYAYRVRGGDEAWSEWLQTRTAAEHGPVSFVYVGDAQNAVRSHWARLIRAAFQEAPHADFILHAGDLVDHASRDLEWAEWFEATGFIHGMIPAAPVAGNHEYQRVELAPNEQDRLLSIMWRPQFTLPEDPSLPDDLQEAAYEVRYSQDVHLFVISTQNRQIAEQAAWLDARLSESDARWRIVSMHHPIFSSGRGRDSAERRDELLPVLNKHQVDLVLQGHDHTYARGVIGQTPERYSFQEAGGDVTTMFVNSVSGPKQYEFKDTGWSEYESDGVDLVRQAENTQFFQVITIDGHRLDYRAMTALGELYDDFSMEKSDDGSKRITRGATSTMDARAFENTGRYEAP